MEHVYRDYKNETKPADAYVAGTHIEDSVTDKIRKLPYVREAEGAMLVKYNAVIDRNQSDLYVHSFKQSPKKVLNPPIRSGERLKEDAEGLWIDEDHARANGLRAGDEISIAYDGAEHRVKILGTVLDAENIYFVTAYSETVPDHVHHGYGYMSEKYAKK